MAYQKPPGSVWERLRKEPVSLDGGLVWVWELTTAEMLTVKERSQRPQIDRRAGLHEGAAAAWLAAFCTHQGDEEGSPRVWDDLNFEDVLQLRAGESTALLEACNRVNSLSEVQIEAAED